MAFTGTCVLTGMLALIVAAALGAGGGGHAGSTEASTANQVPRGRQEQKRFREQQQTGEATDIEPSH